MNFVYLARKYFNVDCICEDRSYEGLIWPKDAHLEKPPQAVFEAYQGEEDRLNRVVANQAQKRTERIQESQKQAVARSFEDIIPFEDRLKAEHEKLREEAYEIRKGAVEAKLALSARASHIEPMWREISEVQSAVSQEAQQYLDDTSHMLSWDPQKVPVEVLSKREEAHKRVEDGKLVYGNWQQMRAKDMPTREELRQAVKAGGEHLARLQKICQDVALKYPKPRKTY